MTIDISELLTLRSAGGTGLNPTAWSPSETGGDLPSTAKYGSMYIVGESGQFNNVRFVEGDIVIVDGIGSIANLTTKSANTSTFTYTRFDPDNKGATVVLSNDNKTASIASGSAVTVGVTGLITGNKMMEFTAQPGAIGFGVINALADLSNPSNLGTAKYAFAIIGNGLALGSINTSGTSATNFTFTNAPSTVTTADVFGSTFNSSTREAQFYFNGTRLTTSPSTLILNSSSDGFIFGGYIAGAGAPLIGNFGDSGFAHPISTYSAITTTVSDFYGPLTVIGTQWNPNTGYPSVSPNPGDLYYASVAGEWEGKEYYAGSGIWYDGAIWRDLQAYNPVGIPVGSMIYLGDLTYVPTSTGPTYVEGGVYRIVGENFIWRDSGLTSNDAKRWAPVGSTIVGANNKWQILTTSKSSYDNGRSFGTQPKLYSNPAYANADSPEPVYSSSKGELEFLIQAYSTGYLESQFGLYQTRNADGEVIDITTEALNKWAVIFDMNTNEFAHIYEGVKSVFHTLTGNVGSGTKLTFCFNGDNGSVRIYQDGVFLISYVVNPPSGTYDLQPAGFHKASYATYDMTGVTYNSGRFPFTYIDSTVSSSGSPTADHWVIAAPQKIIESPLLIDEISLAKVPSPIFAEWVSGDYAYEGYSGTFKLALTPSNTNTIGYAGMYTRFEDTYSHVYYSPNSYNGLKYVTSLTGISPITPPSCSYALNADLSEITTEGYNGQFVTDVTEQVLQYSIQSSLGSPYSVAAFPSGFLSGTRIPVTSNANPDEPVMIQFKLGQLNTLGQYSDYLPDIMYGSAGYVIKLKFLNSDGTDGFVINLTVNQAYYVLAEARSLSGTLLSNMYSDHTKLVSLLISSDGTVQPYIDNYSYSSFNAGTTDDLLLVVEVIESSTAMLSDINNNTIQITVVSDQANFSPANVTPAIYANIGLRDVCLTPYNYVEYANIDQLTFSTVIANSDGSNWFNAKYLQRMEFLSNYTVIGGEGAPTDALTANEGDVYVDNNTSDIYGPYTGGTWTSQIYFNPTMTPSYVYEFSNFNRTLTYNFNSYYNNAVNILPYNTTSANNDGKHSIGLKIEDYTGVVNSSAIIYSLLLGDNVNYVTIRITRYGDRIVYEKTTPVSGTSTETITESFANNEEILLCFTASSTIFTCTLVAPSGTEYPYTGGGAGGGYFSAYSEFIPLYGGGGSGSLTGTLTTVRNTGLTVPTGYETAYWELSGPTKWVDEYTYSVATPTIEIANVVPGHLQYRKADGNWTMIRPYYGYDRGYTVGYSVGNGDAIVTNENSAIIATISQGELETGSFYHYSIIDIGDIPISSNIEMSTTYTEEPSVYRYSRPIDPPLPFYNDGKAYRVTVAGTHNNVQFGVNDLILNGNDGNTTWKIPHGIDPIYKNILKIGTDNVLAMTTVMNDSTLIIQENGGANTITLSAAPTYQSPKPGTVIRVTQNWANSPITINANFAFLGVNQNSTTISTKNRGDTIELIKISEQTDMYESWQAVLIQCGEFIPLATNIETQTVDYVLELSDSGGIVEMNSSSPNKIIISQSVNHPIGTVIKIVQMGTGQTTIDYVGGASYVSKGGANKLSAQYSSAELYKRSSTVWVLTGDITT